MKIQKRKQSNTLVKRIRNCYVTIIRAFKKLKLRDVITYILTVIIILCTLRQNKKINELTYKDRAIEHKPIIEIIGTPQIKVEYLYHRGAYNSLLNRVDLEIEIKIKQVVKLANIGNEKATLVCQLFCDTLTNENILRNCLLNKKMLNTFEQSSYKSYFNEKELFPNDTFLFEDERRIGIDTSTKIFVNHLLILYKNDYGVFYDTYIKSKFKLNQPLFEPSINLETGNLQFYLGKNAREFFLLEEPSRTTQIYTEEEKELIIKAAKEYEKMHKKTI
jgi:hypothetical protein